MRKSVQKALANQRRQSHTSDTERKVLSSTSKDKRKLRKQMIEDDFGNVPIR